MTDKITYWEYLSIKHEVRLVTTYKIKIHYGNYNAKTITKTNSTLLNRPTHYTRESISNINSMIPKILVDKPMHSIKQPIESETKT